MSRTRMLPVLFALKNNNASQTNVVKITSSLIATSQPPKSTTRPFSILTHRASVIRFFSPQPQNPAQAFGRRAHLSNDQILAAAMKKITPFINDLCDIATDLGDLPDKDVQKINEELFPLLKNGDGLNAANLFAIINKIENLMKNPSIARASCIASVVAGDLSHTEKAKNGYDGMGGCYFQFPSKAFRDFKKIYAENLKSGIEDAKSMLVKIGTPILTQPRSHRL